MMRNKILSFIFIFAATALVQSCLKNDEEVFGESGDRVENYLKEAKELLASAENGWALGYYPHRQLKFGGFNYVLKFTTDNKVTVWYEEAPTDKAESTYAMSSDDGPILTFDTYNKYMHKFATPSQGEYEAKDGDFEFILLKVQQDTITLKGKRSGNEMYMTRLNSSPSSYLQSIRDFMDNARTHCAGTATMANQNYNAVFDLQNRKFLLLNDQYEEVESRMIIYTPTGISLASVITVGDISLKDFTFDKSAKTYTSAGVTFNLQQTFKGYSDYIGSYTVKELNNRQVTFTQDKIDDSYVVKGILSGKYDIAAYSSPADEEKQIDALEGDGNARAYYDPYWGTFYFKPHFLGKASGFQNTYYVYMYMTDGDMVYFGDDYKSTMAVYPGEKLIFQLGANGYGLTDWFWTKPRLSDDDNESVGPYDEFPRQLTWTKQ